MTLEQELTHLLFASYPTRINRYNLKFSVPPKKPHFASIGSKRKPALAKDAGDGDLFLNESLRRQMRNSTNRKNLKKLKEWRCWHRFSMRSLKFSPTPTHWIPINLQLFNSFSKDLCGVIFSELENEEILAFLDAHDDQFQRFGKFYRMDDESKLITKRFIEVSDAEVDEELIGKIQRQWDLDQEKASERKLKLEQEQKNFQIEIGDIETQINSLASAKENLMEDFKNPISAKPQKIYSFNSSLLLIVLGLGTIAASLFKI